MIYLHVQSLDQIVGEAPTIARRRMDESQRAELRLYQRSLIAQVTGQTTEQLQIEANDFGKPILKFPYQFQFNQSHSQQSYVMAISDEIANIGVDIEDLNRQVRFEALAKHAFHPEEMKVWKALNYDRAFWFKVWTSKEAVLKAHGLGIRLSLNTLNTHAHPTWDFGVVEHELLGSFYYQNIVMPYAMLTVAYPNPHQTRSSDSIQKIKWF